MYLDKERRVVMMAKDCLHCNEAFAHILGCSHEYVVIDRSDGMVEEFFNELRNGGHDYLVVAERETLTFLIEYVFAEWKRMEYEGVLECDKESLEWTFEALIKPLIPQLLIEHDYENFI